MPGKRVVSTKNYTESTLNENTSIDQTKIRSIVHIFEESEDVHAHERLIVDLKVNFYEKLHLEAFNLDLYLCLRFLLLCDDRQRTEKPFLFIVKFIMLCFKDEKLQKRNEKMFRKFIHFLHHHRCMSEPMVRFHVVQLLKILLAEINDSIELTDSVFEEMQRLVISRLWDTKTYIRAEAAAASSRLQDPENAKCPIVIGLMHLSRYDSSHTVRLAAIQSLAITTKTLPYILYRCYDVYDSIRKKAYELLTKWKILKPLTISKRLQLVESGLNDKEKSVQTACLNLLKTWFTVCNNDPVLLLRRFDVENSEISTKQAFNGLLKNMSEDEINGLVEYLKKILDEKNLIQLENLNGESAFFWRHLVSYLSSNSTTYGEILEQILPNMHDFNEYLRSLFLNPVRYEDPDNKDDEGTEVFSVLKQLLPILKFLDIFDEHNRKDVVKLISWCLASRNVPFNYVEDLMKLLVRLEKNNTKFCDMVVEIINDLLYDTLEDNEHNQTVVPKDSTILAGNIGMDDVESTVTKEESVIQGADPQSMCQSNKLRSEDSIAEHALAIRERIRMKTFELAQLRMQIMDVKDKIEAQMQKDIGDNETIQLIGQLNELNKQKKTTEEEKQALLESSVLKTQQPSKKQTSSIASSNTLNDSKKMDLDNVSNQQPSQPITDAGESCTKEGDNADTEENDGDEEEDQANELNWNKPGMENIIIKACCITTSMIQACTMLWNMPSSLRSLYENVILVCVQHTNLLVRRSAFVSMGLCCLLDKDIAVKYYKVFMQGLQIDHESIKEVAVESLVDLFIRFGIEPFQEDILASKEQGNTSKNISKMDGTNNSSPNESQLSFKEESEISSVNYTEEDYNKSTMELFNPIIALLNNKSIRSTVAIGLSKLIYNQKLMSTKLLSRLLLLWFSPETIDEYKLRAHISSLFTSFCLSSLENQQIVVSCFLPTIRSLTRAPDDNPLSKIDIGSIVSFFEQITDSRLLLENRLNVKKKDGKVVEAFKQIAEKENPCHDELAIQLVNQILRSPQSSESRHLLAMLSRLRLSQYKPYPVKEDENSPPPDEAKENDDCVIMSEENIESEKKENETEQTNSEQEPEVIEEKAVVIDEKRKEADEEQREKLREINRQLAKLLGKVKDRRLLKDLEEMHLKLDKQILTEESKKEGGLDDTDGDKTLCLSTGGKTSISSTGGAGSDNLNPPTLLESQSNLQSELGPGGGVGGQSLYLGSRIATDLTTSHNNTSRRLHAGDLSHRHLKSMRPGYALPPSPSTIADTSMTTTTNSTHTKLSCTPMLRDADPDPSLDSDTSSDVIIVDKSKDSEELSSPNKSMESTQNRSRINVRNVSKSADKFNTSRSSSRSNASSSTMRKPSTPKKPRRDNSESEQKKSVDNKDDSAVFKVPKMNIRLTRNSSLKASNKNVSGSQNTPSTAHSPSKYHLATSSSSPKKSTRSPRKLATSSSSPKKSTRSPRKPITSLAPSNSSPRKTLTNKTTSPQARSRSNPSRPNKPDTISKSLAIQEHQTSPTKLTRRESAFVSGNTSNASSLLKRKSGSSLKSHETPRMTRNLKTNVRLTRSSSKI